jgi:AcrR family transcriptional regulator
VPERISPPPERGSSGGPRAEKHERQRTAVEATALELFVAHGFDAVTVDEIAQAAGLSRATVFRYFGSKEAILFANHPRELASLHRLLDEHPGARGSVSELREVVGEFADLLEAEGAGLRQRARVVASHPRLMAVALGTREDWAAAIGRWLAAEGRVSLRHEILGAVAVESLVLGVRRWVTAKRRPRLRHLVEDIFAEITTLGTLD